MQDSLVNNRMKIIYSKLFEDCAKKDGDLVLENVDGKCSYAIEKHEAFAIFEDASKVVKKAYDEQSDIYYAELHDYFVFVVAKSESDLLEKVSTWKWSD